MAFAWNVPVRQPTHALQWHASVSRPDNTYPPLSMGQTCRAVIQEASSSSSGSRLQAQIFHQISLQPGTGADPAHQKGQWCFSSSDCPGLRSSKRLGTGGTVDLQVQITLAILSPSQWPMSDMASGLFCERRTAIHEVIVRSLR